MNRPISEIAWEILADWKKPNFAALPYIHAMRELENADSKVGFDNARDIVERFLYNAGTYRGDKARALKAELKAIVRK